MNQDQLLALVRNFPQNGLRLLLETPATVREFLSVSAPKYVRLIDFDRMKPEPADFITRDFRHVESDLVLRAPARKGAARGLKEVFIYVLLEHQSGPERLMMLRLLDYTVQIYKSQMRAWEKKHRTLAGFKLQPVLPIVLYTGDRPWPKLEPLHALMNLGVEFASVTPAFEPILFNLSSTADARLRDEGGFFGLVLSLFRHRSDDATAFRSRLGDVVGALERMPRAERFRWLEMLTYLQALLYHVREGAEHDDLSAVVEASVNTDDLRRQFMAKKQTMAQKLQEDASISTSKDVLLRQLRIRFGEVPNAIGDRVRKTDALKTLATWLDRMMTANQIEDVGILGRK